MHTQDAPASTRFKVGIFTVAALAVLGGLTVFVNDRPFWWRPCQLVHINIEDATGLKPSSGVRSLGLEIGYLKTVELSETHVTLGICITAPVEVLPATRAYIRGEGFLGDKFVELKPVRYLGPSSEPVDGEEGEGAEKKNASSFLQRGLREVVALVAVPSARAQEPSPRPRSRTRGREIPVGAEGQDVQRLVNRVDELVNEMTNLTSNLKQAINPEDLRRTMQQLNKVLENASSTLAPEGGLNQTAQRTLAKLEDAVEQIRAVLTRVNQGQGSVGMVLNDPSYAEELREAIRNINQLLSRVGGIRFVVDVGAEQVPAYDGGRGWFRLGIWPVRDRYYLVGISADPRGRRSVVKTTTTVGVLTTETLTVQEDQTALLLTAMLGKVFWKRLDVGLGAFHGDGTLHLGLKLGPTEREDALQVTQQVYSRFGGTGTGIDGRLTVMGMPWGNNFYLKAGFEGFRKAPSGKIPYLFGAGVTFDDNDIKLLFALR